MTRAQRLKIFESNYGRDFGWWVEHAGQAWATLTGPRQEDMFWVSYHVTPLREPARVWSQAFWEQRLCFRNRELDGVAPNAFAALGAAPTPEHPRVNLRALYLSCEGPTLLERLLLWRHRRAA